MTTYFGDWSKWEDVALEFAHERCGDEAKTLALKAFPKPDEVIFANYTIDGYDGSALVLYRNDAAYWIVEGSHCSCYGLEGQWEPEDYSLPLLITALEKRGAYGALTEHHRTRLLRKLKRRLKLVETVNAAA